MDRWWREQRPATPDLFALELAAARELIAKAPEVGPPFIERQGVIVRRILLPKTNNHVYYEIQHDEGRVMILAVWGAPRGRRPKL